MAWTFYMILGEMWDVKMGKSQVWVHITVCTTHATAGQRLNGLYSHRNMKQIITTMKKEIYSGTNGYKPEISHNDLPQQFNAQ